MGAEAAVKAAMLGAQEEVCGWALTCMSSHVFALGLLGHPGAGLTLTLTPALA